MTLADYSLSDVAFDEVDRWRNTLKQLVTSCNQTTALGAMIPQLEEFIHVARSELVCSRLIICCIHDLCDSCVHQTSFGNQICPAFLILNISDLKKPKVLHKEPGIKWTVKTPSFVVSYLWWTRLHETHNSKVKSSQVSLFLLFQSLGWLPPSLLVSTL